MIYFEHYGRKSARENVGRATLLMALTFVLAILLAPFTLLLALFWAAWDLAFPMQTK